MTLSRMSQAAKLAERARRCVGYHETWADHASAWARLRAGDFARTSAHRARVALASARATYARLGALLSEESYRATL